MIELKPLRERLGLRQIDVARLLGISKQAYFNYESGKCSPDYEMLLRLGEVFGVSVDYLLRGDEKSTPAETRRSAIVGRVMSLSDDQLLALAEALEALGDPAPKAEESRNSPESE